MGGNQSLMGMCKGKIYFRDFLHIKHIHLSFFCSAWDDCLISNLQTSDDTAEADPKRQNEHAKLHDAKCIISSSLLLKVFTARDFNSPIICDPQYLKDAF